MIHWSHVILALVGLFAGTVGALAGIGGGIILIPVLSIYFGVPLHQAVGTSLVAVIATSTATSSVYVERGVSDIRLGMTLELATTIGAAVAAVTAAYLSRRSLAVIFVVFLCYTATALARRVWTGGAKIDDKPTPEYNVHRYPLGMSAAFVAGGLSGLLGIGGGPIKVPVMYLFMGVPLRVATATSNFMIGVTAATSALIYYSRGDVPIAIVAPVVTGVFFGSMVAARLSTRVKPRYIVALLVGISAYLAAQMIIKLAGGGFR